MTSKRVKITKKQFIFDIVMCNKAKKYIHACFGKFRYIKLYMSEMFFNKIILLVNFSLVRR